MGFMNALASGVAKGADAVGDYYGKAAIAEELSRIEEEKAARLAEKGSALRLSEDTVRRDRDVSYAAADRARVDTDARGFAEKRGGMMAANAGLDDVNYRGDEGVGTNVQKGQSEPTVRDRLMASGKYEAVAADERADKTATQHVKERAEDVRFKEAELKLRQASEGRLAKSADLDTALKQITLDNTKRVQVLRTEFAAATPERQAKINDEIQLITGKDNDKFMPVPIKDEMGNVSGYKIFDTKAGRFVEQNAGGSAKTVAVGDVVGGFKFKGGATNDKSNWEAATTPKPAASAPKKQSSEISADEVAAVEKSRAEAKARRETESAAKMKKQKEREAEIDGMAPLTHTPRR